MLIEIQAKSKLSINSLEDLALLGKFEEGGSLKVNKSQIARDLNVDVRTVSKYMNGYKKKTTRNRKSYLDDYYDIITDLLNDEFQKFFYKRVLWQYLKDNHGLKCPQSSFRRWIQKHEEFQSYFNGYTNRTINGEVRNSSSKRNHVLHNPSHAGEYASLDWKESMCITLSTGEVVVVNIFALVFAYSRYKVYFLSLTKTQSVLFHFLDQAFQKAGGVPKYLKTDNMKTVMDESRTEFYEGKVNAKFAQFAKDYGFEVKPCIAGEPEVKANVESPMKILDELFAYNGKLDLGGLNKKLEEINDRINFEFNENLGLVPILALEKEKDFLSPLPNNTIRNHYKIKTSSLKVSSQSTITYQKRKYVVPPEYIGKYLEVQAYDDYLHIYFNTKMVTIYEITDSKYNTTQNFQEELVKMSFKNIKDDNLIKEIAKNNLQRIGDIYK